MVTHVTYANLADVLSDPELRLPAGLSDADEARDLLARRLMQMQVETVNTTTDDYRRVLAAWELLNDLRTKASRPPSTDLVPAVSHSLEVVVQAIADAQKEAASAALASSEKATADARRTSAETRMLDRKVASVTAATADFTKGRTFPTAALGTASAVIWATRSDFGADFSGAGTVWWSLVAGATFVASGVLLWFSHREQQRMKSVLRALYDPDVQAEALLSAGSGFRRSDFRTSLVHLALHASGERIPRRGLRRYLSTIDLVDAQIDASNLALERFQAMGVLTVDLRHGETFFTEWGYTPDDRYGFASRPQLRFD